MTVLLNLLLFTLKFIAGKLSGSVSIIADAFNNLTDAGTVLFAEVGVKIASIGPGEKHPDGHGKFEWIFALITSFSVLLVGWELLKDSIKCIQNPSNMVFSWISLSILVLSVGVKVFLYFYNMNKSKKKNLISLKAVAIDSLSDAISTMAVLISLVLNTVFQWKLDGFIGAAVSILIMYNALKVTGDSVSSIVGPAASEKDRKALTEVIESFFDSLVPIVDLKITDNGYNRRTASFHLVSTEKISAEKLLHMVPLIQKRIQEQYGFESIVQVEKSTDIKTSTFIIKMAKEKLKELGDSYTLSNARVLTCNNKTNQLVATIITPWLDKSDSDKLQQFVLKPESFGLTKNDSVLIQIKLGGHKQNKLKNF